MEMSEDGSSLKLGDEHCDFAGAAITNCYRLGGLQHSRVSSSSLEARHLRAGAGRAVLPLRARGKDLLQAPLQLLVGPGLGTAHLLSSCCVLPMEVSLSKFPLLLRMPAYWVRPTLLQYDLTLT